MRHDGEAYSICAEQPLAMEMSAAFWALIAAKNLPPAEAQVPVLKNGFVEPSPARAPDLVDSGPFAGRMRGRV